MLACLRACALVSVVVFVCLCDFVGLLFVAMICVVLCWRGCLFADVFVYVSVGVSALCVLFLCA